MIIPIPRPLQAPKVSGIFPEFFPEKFRRKFPEISELTTLDMTLFTRATRSIARYVLRQRGWVAEWVSVTRRYCIKSAKPILKLFRLPESPIILVSYDSCADTQFQGEPLHWGVLNTRGAQKNWRFSTEIAVYLGNGARLADGYYGTLIGSHGCRIEWYCWYHFRWPWVTPIRV